MLGYYLLAILSSVYFLGSNGATLGQACNETDVCNGTYQVCNTICVCGTGYYDNTGTSDIGGTCEQKPNKVQEITSSDDDLDVEINGLTIRYTPGTGGRSGFNVRLFDGETQIAEKNTGQVNTSITMYNSNLPNNYGDLKNGYNYTVKIKTMSESYDNGHVVESDVFEAIMKTTPKHPNPPQNGQCGDVSDDAITVTWNPPAVPNGYIIRYHVQVYQPSSSFVFTRSTVNDVTSLRVYGLEPGTSYYLILITENEVGNSSASDWISSGCNTTAKKLSRDSEITSSDLTAIIGGVVLGVIILILLLCIGYLMVKQRRLSNQGQTKQPDVQQQPQYVNQMCLDVVSQPPDVENIPSPEDNYTSLNEETREKSIYTTF